MGKSLFFGDIEVAPVSEWKKLLWAEGKDYAKSLGEGWHMPTTGELEKLCKSENFVNLFTTRCGEDGWAWSSIAYSGSTAWFQKPSNGYQSHGNKYGVLWVVPCRKVILEKAEE